jgi:hypothetical protein
MERNRKSINIAELRVIVDAILSHIEEDMGIKEVDLTEDYYWNFVDEVAYMGEVEQDAMTVGSLYADLEFLLPLLSNKEQAFPLMLVHVAPLLRYLSTKV